MRAPNCFIIACVMAVVGKAAAWHTPRSPSRAVAHTTIHPTSRVQGAAARAKPRTTKLARTSRAAAAAGAPSAYSNSKPTAVYALILANFVSFILDKILHLPMMSMFYLYHSQVSWWQPITSVFCHGSQAHLSGNIFLLLLFGRSVEDDLGASGLLFTFCFCGILANLVSLVMLPPNTVSLGASGAVFGLFTVSVMARLSPRELDWRKLIEVLVLGEFVVGKMLSEMKTAAMGGVAGVNHVAHLAGAGSGILMVALLRIFVNTMEKQEKK